MKILVCLKQVPDTTNVRLSEDFTMERDSVAHMMNPADESALELALRFRDKHGGHVTVLSMGPTQVENILREAISRGADRAVQLTDSAFAGSDTLITAQCLREAAMHMGGFDLILCGRRSIDGETGQVGPMIAALDQRSCVTNAINAIFENNALLVDQLTEAGIITWKMHLPALITLCERSYRLRLPTLAGLRHALHTQVERFTASDLGIAHCGLKASPTRVTRVSIQPTSIRHCQKLPLDQVLDDLEKKGVVTLR